MILIKREKWGGIAIKDSKGKIISRTPAKFKVVAREQGRIVSHAKWSKKFNVVKAKSKFKKDRTFRADLQKISRTNVVEVKDTSERPSLRKGFVKVQWFVEGYVRDGKKRIFISARSMQVNVSDIQAGMFKISDLQDEARSSWFERVAQAFGLKYDEDEGQALVAMGSAQITDEGLIHYEPRR